ncbi:MAG TPA: hypothetical protein VMJ31_06330, partial [Methylocystis sp.]|nr:hypothetical protein [Methylocystis sp.]
MRPFVEIQGVHSMAVHPLFCFSKVVFDPRSETSPVPAFLVESTAPLNFDTTEPPLPLPDEFKDYLKASSLDDIIDALAKAPKPSLLITVHGYNTPRTNALETYAKSFLAVHNDPEFIKAGVVCIGYRWPLESAGMPQKRAAEAAPGLLLGVLGFGMACALAAWYYEFTDNLVLLRIILGMAAAFAAVVPLTLFLLRWFAYFRDGYRATNYGVPDLVDLIREIDAELVKKAPAGRTVDLSFIGHSMGGFVVTNAVRILSDVFAPEAVEAKYLEPGSDEELKYREARSRIGSNKSIRLRRLVLVSPDIPGEVLLSGRGNALESSLIRFKEAHLFCNEGDEVLRSISTTANFFALPTRNRRFGYRLGNVGVLSGGYGVSQDFSLDKLRLGWRTLSELYKEMGQPQASDQGQSEVKGKCQAETDAQKRDSFVKMLAYFDCTDSLDDEGRGVVTDAKKNAPPWFLRKGA